MQQRLGPLVIKDKVYFFLAEAFGQFFDHLFPHRIGLDDERMPGWEKTCRAESKMEVKMIGLISPKEGLKQHMGRHNHELSWV